MNEELVVMVIVVEILDLILLLPLSRTLTYRHQRRSHKREIDISGRHQCYVIGIL